MRPAVAALAVFLAALSPPAAALYAHGPIQPGGKADGVNFPQFYMDEAGQVCAPCLHLDAAGSGPCLSTKETAAPVDEFFYYAVLGTITGPGGVEISYENAVEGAYANDQIKAGDEIVFQRTRVRIDCPAANPPPGRPYVFEVTTPYGEVVRETATEGGKRCVSFTSDVGGLLPGQFSSSLTGPITFFLKANPAPARRPGFPPQLGDFPNEIGAVFPDGSPAVLRVTSPASPTSTSAFPGELTTRNFATSCQVAEGSTMVFERAEVVVNAADRTGRVNVWVTAGPSERPTVSVEGVTRPLIKNTYEPANPPAPGSFRPENRPAAYFAQVSLPARAANKAWHLDVQVASGSKSITKSVRPAAAGTATLNGAKLTIKASTPDANQEFTLSLRKPDGTFSPLPITPADGAPARSKFTGTADGSFNSPAPPAGIWACMDPLPGAQSKDPECFALQMLVEAVDAGPPGNDNVQASHVLTTPATVVSGARFTLDASKSSPPEGGPCSGQWAQLSGPGVGNIPAGYVATLTAPATTSLAALTFEFRLTGCPASIQNTVSQPVTVSLSGGVAADFTLDLASSAPTGGNVFTGQPFTLTPSLAARTAGGGAPIAVAGATFKTKVTNCGPCGAAASACLDATTQIITCRPDAAGAVSVEVAAFPPGATQPVIVSTFSATASGDILSAASAQIDARQASRGRGWKVDLRVTSAAAASGTAGVTLAVYYTTSTNCGANGASAAAGETCAKRFFELSPSIACAAAGGVCSLAREITPRQLGTTPLGNPAGAGFLYVVTSAGGALSLPVTIRT